MVVLFHGKNDKRCPVCLCEWNEAVLTKAGIKQCPNCKTIIAPMNISEDGYIRINWQDMRVLAVYAKRWSSMFDLSNKGNRDAIQALVHILYKIEGFRPKTAKPLTPIEDDIVIAKIKNQKGVPLVQIAVDRSNKAQEEKDATGSILSPYFKKAG